MQRTAINYEPTAQDVEQYAQQGYWISPKLLSDEQIASLRREMDRLFAGERDGNGSYFEGKLNLPKDPHALRRVVNAWWVNAAVRDVVLDAGLGRICAKLMKVPGIRLWSDQVIIKPEMSPDGKTQVGNVGWHQDFAYWQIPSTHNMVTAWIALQDTDLSNGGMRTLIGSHRWGLIKDSDAFFDTDLDALRKKFADRVDSPWLDEPCILKAGQASFHHSLCFHGSGENLSDKPRLSVVGHYMPDGTTFAPYDKVTTQLRMLGPWPEPGEKLADPNFPLVYSEASYGQQ
jgi:ectoine hydroxylase-related dioxygenase (phytanoyl-CoA dioxygenase family)